MFCLGVGVSNMMTKASPGGAAAPKRYASKPFNNSSAIYNYPAVVGARQAEGGARRIGTSTYLRSPPPTIRNRSTPAKSTVTSSAAPKPRPNPRAAKKPPCTPYPLCTGRPPAPGSLKPSDIWAPKGSPVFLTELKTSVKKRSFPCPFSTPDDWLREVLEFFDADNASSRADAPHNKFLINFGAHYMPSDVVALAQAMADAVGCAIDSDDPMTYTAAGVRKHIGFVTPSNVGAMLSNCATPRRPLLLKMDIDSVDVDVTLGILSAGYSPAFIFVELNEKVPPPICYCNRFVPTSPMRPTGWARLGGHHYGCSLTGFVNALAPRRYRLVAVILNDALFVHQRHAAEVAQRLPGGVLPTPEAAFAAGYRDVPGRSSHYSWNADVDHWLDDKKYSLDQRAQMVRQFFGEGINATKNGRYADFSVGSTAWPCQEASVRNGTHIQGFGGAAAAPKAAGQNAPSAKATRVYSPTGRAVPPSGFKLSGPSLQNRAPSSQKIQLG